MTASCVASSWHAHSIVAERSACFVLILNFLLAHVYGTGYLHDVIAVPCINLVSRAGPLPLRGKWYGELPFL